jgi:hypothetical protein
MANFIVYYIHTDHSIYYSASNYLAADDPGSQPVVYPGAQGLHDGESTWELCLRMMSNSSYKTDRFLVNDGMTVQ